MEVPSGSGINKDTTFRESGDNSNEEMRHVSENFVGAPHEIPSKDDGIENPEMKQSRNEDSEELYPGCKTFTSSSFHAELMNLKVKYNCTDKSIDMLVELLKEAFPGFRLPEDREKETRNPTDSVLAKMTPVAGHKRGRAPQDQEDR